MTRHGAPPKFRPVDPGAAENRLSRRRRVLACPYIVVATLGLVWFVWCWLPGARLLGFAWERGFESRSYLVVYQNSEELRATGGFMSMVGLARFERGWLAEFRLEKVYAAEGVAATAPPPMPTSGYVQPPAPLARYMGIGEWRLRDANWWPQHDRSAREIARQWTRLGYAPVHGVVFVTDQVVGRLFVDAGLYESGEAFRFAHADLTFRGDSPADWHTDQSRLARQSARDFLGAMATRPVAWRDALGTIRRAIDEREIVVELFDLPAAGWLGRIGARPALLPGSLDQVALVEDNLSYAKLSPFIRRELRYRVQLQPSASALDARLTILHANDYSPGAGNPFLPDSYYDGGFWIPADRRLATRAGYYGGYSRAVISSDAKDIAAAGFLGRPDITRDVESTQIGGYTPLDSGEARQSVIEWRRVVTGLMAGYSLTIRRQPGTAALPYVIEVSLPPGSSIVHAAEGAEIEANLARWRGELTADQRFWVTYAAR